MFLSIGQPDDFITPRLKINLIHNIHSHIMVKPLYVNLEWLLGLKVQRKLYLAQDHLSHFHPNIYIVQLRTNA